MSRHAGMSIFGTGHAPTTLTGSCGSSPGIACRIAWDLTHNGQLASLTDNFLAGPVHLLLRVVYVLALAFLIRAVLHRLINRITERAADTLLPQFRNGMTSSLRVPDRLRPRRARGGMSAKAGSAQEPHNAAEDEMASGGGVVADIAEDRASGGGVVADIAEDRASGGGVAADAVDAADAGLTADAIGAEAAGGAPVTGPAAEAEGIRDAQAGGMGGEGTGPDRSVDAASADSGQIAAAAARAERALVAERRHQRVRALGSILRSATSVAIFSIAGVVVLGDLGINLAPLLASAGVVGIAIGFGAQNMVRDYLSGIFMLLEDQYGVGDVISVGDATGTVETVTLRITRLRDVNGIVWHVRNGAIEQVGNESQGWARAVIDFPVPYAADLSTIRTLLSDAADSMWNEPRWRSVMLEQPEVWGAQEVLSDEVIMRIVVKTAPLRQWEVEREMRARIKTALDAAGIQFPADAQEPAHRASSRRHSASK